MSAVSTATASVGKQVATLRDFIRMSAVSTATASVGKQVATLRDFILDSSEDRGGGAAIPTPDTEN
jgi:hypothetical protein